MDHVIDATSSALSAPARPPVASFVVEEDVDREPSLVERLLGAPGWTFHAICGVGALSMLWAASSPTGLDLTGDPFAWVGLACLVAFLARFVAAASRRTLTTAFLGVPLMVAAVAGLEYEELPQELRWMQAEGGFESTLRALPTAKKWDQTAADDMTPGRIGSYWVDGVTRDSAGAAQFHLASPFGGTVGAAFTYLVDGPTDEVRAANPGATFEHLKGNWYVVRHAN
ncbi:hypothetical protein GCM10009547_14910 [Sporichthya brevicatena]|uniref:Uncharacterized protein n=1 Tax=Sporichthya brevicatena TaxID=171442 RepID=A0ABN1GLI1_9ACTN